MYMTYCATSWFELCVTIDFDYARMFSTATFDTDFSYHLALWMAASDCYLYFYLSTGFAITLSKYVQVNVTAAMPKVKSRSH